MNKSLINLDALSRPATTLIEKISDAIGGIFKPRQIIRVALAEAEAEKIRAETQIEVADLNRRAIRRFFQEEAIKQKNIEDITSQALPLLRDGSKPENVDNDWIANFFEKSRIVSDQDMQQLWSQILASEANSPGSFSKKTVNLLSDLDKGDAQLFANLCQFVWEIGYAAPLIYDVQGEIYNQSGINFGSLSHLETLGLIQFNSVTGFRRLKLPKSVIVVYQRKALNLAFPKDNDNELNLGFVLLTKPGQELFRVCASAYNEKFFNFIYDEWAVQSLIPKRS